MREGRTGARYAMTDWTAYVAGLIGAFIAFLATNVEPHAGVWIASTGGALLSVMTGGDRGSVRLLAHLALGLAVGLAISQFAVEFIKLESPRTRVWIAFFAAFFSEKIIVMADQAMTAKGLAAMADRLLPWRKR
jgi:hypothetical protein